MAGEVVHCAEATAGFLQHTVKSGMGTGEVSQSRGQYVRMTHCVGSGFGQGEVDATESMPHSIAFNRAPDAVKLTSAGSTQGFNGVDSGVSQASAHTLSDAGNIVEIEDVETFRQCIVVDCDKAVGLIAFACEFGDKPVGGEADGGAHIGADMGGEGFLNGEGFGFGNFRGLPLWGKFSVHFVDRENRFDVDVLVNEGFDPFVEVNVASVIRLNEADVRAEVARFTDEGTRLDAEGFGLVAGSNAGSRLDSGHGDNANRTAAEAGMELLFNGGKEAVKIDK